MIAGGLGYLAFYNLSLSAPIFYAILFIGTFSLYKPFHLISPLSIIHAYYFVFFLVAPPFAQMHMDDDRSSLDYYYAYTMIFLTHLFSSMGAKAGESIVGKATLIKNYTTKDLREKYKILLNIFILYLVSTSLIAAIVLSSGGFAHWLNAPGDAFLNRAGSGIYVILSHFSSFILASLVGYWGLRYKSWSIVFVFVGWLILTSPVHGSKQLISIILALVLLPWIFNTKLVSVRSIVFTLLLLIIFFAGLYFRNISWMRVEDAIPYALNYFTTLRNLLIIINDFEPGFMTTFFLPFNKFLTPFGLSRPDLYFDMNHMLTDIYFPSAWAIRATEQWPVEADLYLNFYFIFGLPLIFIYFYIIGRIYGKAIKTRNLGMWVAALLLIFSIPSHLRGSLYNHVDFYFYPMIFVIYLILRRYEIPVFYNSRIQQ